jgi:hypothetical protein
MKLYELQSKAVYTAILKMKKDGFSLNDIVKVLGKDVENV